jgi:hypothetical protein
MSAHQPPPTTDEAREALAAITQLVARGFGQHHSNNLRVLQRFIDAHDPPSQAKPSKVSHKDVALPIGDKAK